MHKLPIIESNLPTPKLPITFICVQYSNEFDHNILTSHCVHNELNEFIVVDNTFNLYFPSLCLAILDGVKKATNDLIVVVHEDVVLQHHWHAKLEQSLRALHCADPDWAVAGAVGWDAQGNIVGHSYDPHAFRDTLNGKPYCEVERLDEQILIFQKSKGVLFDPELPSIHHIGRDLPLSAKQRGLKAYVINAPTIHKYADENGKVIQAPTDSKKIQHRQQLDYLADRACADEYIENKWTTLEPSSLDHIQPGVWGHARFSLRHSKPPKSLDSNKKEILKNPIILLAKGGGGSRLLSQMAANVGLFIGNDVNPTGDSREMARTIYRAIFRKYRCSNLTQKKNNVADIQITAMNMLDKANWPKCWGFKLPESLFVLPELNNAFPNAKYIYLSRDPLTSSLRRAHMTASLENQIGQISLTQAYRHFGLDISSILQEEELHRKCRTTAHQLYLLDEFRKHVSNDRWLTLSFEKLVKNPDEVMCSFSSFCRMDIISNKLPIDYTRATLPIHSYSQEEITLASSILNTIRVKFEYR